MATAQKEKRTVLVTGSSGMLGTDLCEALSAGHAVFGFDINYRPTPFITRTAFFEGDIVDPDRVATVILKLRPDAIIHTAAWTDVDGCESDSAKAFRMNADGTAVIARCCKDAGVLLIAMSTDYVFDGSKDGPYREDDEPSPISVYGASKLKAEEAVRAACERYFIVRTSWLFGKNGKNFVDTIRQKAKEGTMKVVTDQIGSPTYTVDLSRALDILLGCASSNAHACPFGIYHVSNDGVVSWYDFARSIIEMARVEGSSVVPIETDQLRRPAPRPKNSALDNTKFVAHTGCRLRSWKEALAAYLGS